MRLTDCRHDRSLCFARMAQFEVRLSRKLYKRGERTEARISLRIQTDSACTCSLPEMTMKLVNRITLVTAHIVRATNMRMIICFMILLLSSCDLPKARTTPLICVTPISTFYKTRLIYQLFYSGSAYISLLVAGLLEASVGMEIIPLNLG